MPYTASTAPPAIKALPAGARDIWIAAFNAAAKTYPTEAQAFAVAWAAVKRKYRKSGDDWVEKADTGDGHVAVKLNDLADILVVPDFVSLVGSVAKRGHGETLDVLFRQGRANASLKAQIQSALVGKEAQINAVWNAAGPHDTHLPLFDLVLRPKAKLQRRILDGGHSTYRFEKEAEEEEKSIEFEALKASDELQVVWGIVIKAGEPDTQRQAFTPEGIREAMHEFNARMLGRRGKVVRDQHGNLIDGEVVESYQAPSPVKYDGKTVPKDAWVMAVKVWDKGAWKGIKEGKFTGLSPKILFKGKDVVMMNA